MSAVTTRQLDELIAVFTTHGGGIGASSDISMEYLNELVQSTESKTDRDPYELNTNIVTQQKLLNAALTRQAILNNMGCNQTYSFEIEQNECKPIANQNSTGTCWLYATLNILRKPFMQKYDLKTFAFSVEYLYFWHKYELANFWLESIISTIELPVQSRLIQYLLFKGCEDGSQFESALNLIEKYGVMPAVCNNNECLGESNEVKVKKKSHEMNQILHRKLREYAMVLRKTYQQNKTDKDMTVHLRKIKKTQLNEVYRVLVICFGKMPRTFDWKYNQKETYKCVSNLSAIQFYREYVKPCYDLNNLVSLANDPRNEYYKLLTVPFYGNVIGGTRKRIQYINVPIGVLKQYTVEMLKDNTGCWFACDVREFCYDKFGSLDDTQFDFKGLLGVSVGMNKKENLEYGASCNSHSMVIVGLDEVNDNVRRWKVENSWSEKRGNKGFVVMTDSWFDKYVYQVLIEKDKLSKDIVNVLETEPIPLPRWDPFAQ
eukprot:329371_1